VAVVGAALVVLLTAPDALAHDRLKSSSPANNAKVAQLKTIELEFTSRMRLPTIVLDDPSGDPVPLDKPRIHGNTVSANPTKTLQPGRHRIAWRVVSSDGHPIEGEITFTVTAPKTSPSPTPSSIPNSDAPTPSTTSAAQPVPVQPPTTAGAVPVAGSEDNAAGATVPAWLWIVIAVLAAIGATLLFGNIRRRRGSTGAG
jgi:hypothetical protein